MNHITEPTINDEIQYIVDNTINQQPKAEIITITKTYDGNYADIKTDTDGTIEYLPVIGKATVGEKAILMPLQNGNYAIIAR